MDDPAASLQSAMAFPVTASMGPAGPLLRQLSSLTSTPEGTSKDEIQRFTKDLGDLCVSLMHQSEVEEPLSSTAKCWMIEVRELCYDTKNFLDDSLTLKHKKKIVRSKFKVLEARAEHAKERWKRTGIAKPSTSKPELASTGRRLPVLHPELIDRGRMDNLAALLGNEKEKQLKVVSLVGLEGVGKTTLARRIYHKTGGQFQCRAFVRVSPNTDMRRLLTTIFSQIKSRPGFSSSEGTVSQPPCCLDAQALITNIKDYLQDKRYFIIIDDLWSTSVWDVIRRAFPDGGFGSRIITTTRVNEVASACCSYQSKNIFQMEPLKYDQSQKLFFSMVFGSEDKVRIPDGIGEVISEIVEKCGGLPLSILNIASLLATEESEINLKQWMDIRDSLLCMRRNPTSRGIMEILNLIYNNLPAELKTCLLYLVVYPEGYTVNKDDLVKQWVIEGLIGEGENKEELAGRYFDELVSRGMIQAVDINRCGVLSCTLHHTVYDIIVNKSLEENFIISVDYFQSARGLLHKVRRLSVQFGTERSARKPEGNMMSEVQSLAFFGFYGCTDFIEECKVLRVLILHVWADQDKVPFDLSAICNLLQLRYLKVACNIAVRLPRKIQNLELLETLEVDTPLVAIPSHIGGLSRLSSLKIAVRVLSRQDIRILQKMAALTALSLDVKTSPTEWIIFGKGGFLVLNFFSFRCSEPRLLIEESAMPKMEKLIICFNAQEACQDGNKPITIEHIASLKEFSVIILGAVAGKGSALTNAVSNHARNPTPIVQLIESRDDEEHGIQEKKCEIMEENHDEARHDYLGKNENKEAEARKSSTGTEPVIPMEPINVYVTFDGHNGDYAAFIVDVVRKLADHPDKASVLAKQQRGKPARFIMITLVGYINETVTVAVRGDNLDLVGFQAQNGRWYEFGTEGRNPSMLTASTFLGCNGDYESLLGNGYILALQKLSLGRASVMGAISTLARYQQQVGGTVDQCTKLELARLMIIICESAWFSPIYNRVKDGWFHESFLTSSMGISWLDASRFLLGRRMRLSDESTINMRTAKEALAIVHLILNRPTVPKPLVEVFGVRADSSFDGAISVVEGEGRTTMTYKNSHGQRDDAPSQGKIDLPLTHTYSRPVSAEGKISIQVDGIPSAHASDKCMTVGDNMLWDVPSDDVVYEKVKISSINIDHAGSTAVLTYAVICPAMEMGLKVQLNLMDHKDDTVARIYGEITVTNEQFKGKSVQLFRRTKHQAIELEVTHLSDGLEAISIPLIKHFVAVPLDLELQMKVSLRVVCSSYKNPISLDGVLLFSPNTKSDLMMKIEALGMEAQVMVITVV